MLYPDYPLDFALRCLSPTTIFAAVANPADRRKLEGAVSLDDVLAAYRPEIRPLI